jgi:hypothetical protein
VGFRAPLTPARTKTPIIRVHGAVELQPQHVYVVQLN